MKNLIIFIRGIPGSGKTTLVRELAKHFKSKIIDPEYTRFSRKHEVRIKKQKYRINLQQTVSALKCNKVVIWVQPWRKVENLDITIENIKSSLKSPPNVLIINLLADKDVCWERSKYKFASLSQYCEFVEKFKQYDLSYPHIILSGELAPEKNTKEILKCLSKQV